jgi:hypothetical protein
VNQVFIGVVRSEDNRRTHVDLYLYDLRTRFLLSHREATLSSGDDGVEQGARLATDLYRDVNLTGAVAAPEERTERVTTTALYERWWFWAAVGVVVASGVVLLTISGGGEEIPEGWTRVGGQFR